MGKSLRKLTDEKNKVKFQNFLNDIKMQYAVESTIWAISGNSHERKLS